MDRYPQYKDSGFEWIGEIPRHWGAGRAKYQLSRNDGGVWGNDFDELNGGTVVIRSTEITIDGKWDLSNPAIRLVSENEIEKYRLIEGDILITKSSGSLAHIGKSCVVDQRVENLKCCYSNFIQRIRFASNAPKLYHYVLNSYLVREQYKYLTQSTTGLGNLDSKAINEVVLPIIPKESQPLVVQYLDKKTTQIDSLVKKLERKIKLLKEYRSVLINQCVTKGLDTNIEMKESEVDWIGEIPKNWDSNRVGRTSYVKGRIGWKGLKSDEFIDVGPYLITGTDFNNGSIDWEKSYRVSQSRFEEDANIIVKNDDVLITKDGTIGKVVHVTDTPGPTTLNSGIFLTRPLNNSYLPRFFYWVLVSPIFSEFVGYSSNGSTILHLYQNVFVNFYFPIPPSQEQLQIVQHLDEKTAHIDSLIEMLKQKIELQKEYRQSLISNVVTGKVRVTEDYK